jgi:cold shock CspA family protein
MPTGTVDWYHPKHGRGVIVLDENGGDAHFDIGTLQRAGLEAAQNGQRLAFGMKRDPQSRRLVADNLTALDSKLQRNARYR